MRTQPFCFVAFTFATTSLAEVASLPKSCNGTITLTASDYLADGQDYGPHPCTIIGPSEGFAYISGNFTASSLDLWGKIIFVKSYSATAFSKCEINNSHVAFNDSVSISDGRVDWTSAWPLRIDGGVVHFSGYELTAASTGGLSVGNGAIVSFTKSNIELTMADLYIEGGAYFTILHGSYLYSRSNGISHISNAFASVLYSEMVHMKAFEVRNSTFTLRGSNFTLENNEPMKVEDSFFVVEDSTLHHPMASLNLVRSSTMFLNASLDTTEDHNVVGGNVSYESSFLLFMVGFFKLSLESDSKVAIRHTIVKNTNGGTYGGLVVAGDPSIYFDKSSQIHCASGQFAPQKGHNGNITVENSTMTFPSCSSSKQAAVADKMLEGQSAAILI